MIYTYIIICYNIITYECGLPSRGYKTTSAAGCLSHPSPRFHEEEAAHIEEDRRICDVRP